MVKEFSQLLILKLLTIKGSYNINGNLVNKIDFNTEIQIILLTEAHAEEEHHEEEDHEEEEE